MVRAQRADLKCQHRHPCLRAVLLQKIGAVAQIDYAAVFKGWAAWSAQVKFENVLISVSLLTFLLAQPAHATKCSHAMVQCSRKDGVETFANLKQMWEERKSVSWIRKNCNITDRIPSGCDWQSGPAQDNDRGQAKGNGSISASNAGSSEVISDKEPAAQPAPANRDAHGKLGPTPAPAREAPIPAAVKETLPDDGIFAQEIAVAAARYKLPPHLIRAVMTVESGGNPLAVSNKNAHGVMQLLPATAQALGVEDINDVGQNILGGARFLRVLANKFEGDLVKVLSGYHAGSMRVMGRDATPFAATDDYVRKVLRTYYQLRDQAAKRGGD